VAVLPVNAESNEVAGSLDREKRIDAVRMIYDHLPPDRGTDLVALQRWPHPDFKLGNKVSVQKDRSSIAARDMNLL
jgi:hypothetical protein